MRPHLYQNNVSAGLSARVQTHLPVPWRRQALLLILTSFMLRLNSSRRVVLRFCRRRCSRGAIPTFLQAPRWPATHRGVTSPPLITCLARLHKCVFGKYPHAARARGPQAENALFSRAAARFSGSSRPPLSVWLVRSSIAGLVPLTDAALSER